MNLAMSISRPCWPFGCGIRCRVGSVRHWMSEEKRTHTHTNPQYNWLNVLRLLSLFFILSSDCWRAHILFHRFTRSLLYSVVYNAVHHSVRIYASCEEISSPLISRTWSLTDYFQLNWIWRVFEHWVDFKGIILCDGVKSFCLLHVFSWYYPILANQMNRFVQ